MSEEQGFVWLETAEGKHWAGIPCQVYHGYQVYQNHIEKLDGSIIRPHWTCRAKSTGLISRSDVNAYSAYRNAAQVDERHRYTEYFHYGRNESFGYMTIPSYTLDLRIGDLIKHRHPSDQEIEEFRDGWLSARHRQPPLFKTRKRRV